MATRAESLLRAGCTVSADGVFGDPAKRARIERAAQTAAVPFHGIWLDAPEPVLEARVGGRVGDASDADARVVRAQATMQTGVVAWTKVPATGDPETVRARVTAVLASGPAG